MTTLFRIGSAEASKAAYGKIEMINPIKTKHFITVDGKCYRPLVSKPTKFGQTNLFATPSAVSALFHKSSRRWSHTDLKYPDFTDYRLESTKDPTKRAIDTEDARKAVPYLAYGVGGMIGLYMTKYIVRGIVEYKSAPSDMLAMASIEINLKDIPEGKSSTYMWRGKPVFVRHRTKEQIEKEQAVDISQLRDPQTDQQRTKKDEWLVVIGICTHLGCVPTANTGQFGGYYCPCHGSHYDLSGRIRMGPAPLNLEVPGFYEFKEDKLIVGKG